MTIVISSETPLPRYTSSTSISGKPGSVSYRVTTARRALQDAARVGVAVRVRDRGDDVADDLVRRLEPERRRVAGVEPQDRVALGLEPDDLVQGGPADLVEHVLQLRRLVERAQRRHRSSVSPAAGRTGRSETDRLRGLVPAGNTPSLGSSPMGTGMYTARDTARCRVLPGARVRHCPRARPQRKAPPLTRFSTRALALPAAALAVALARRGLWRPHLRRPRGRRHRVVGLLRRHVRRHRQDRLPQLAVRHHGDLRADRPRLPRPGRRGDQRRRRRARQAARDRRRGRRLRADRVRGEGREAHLVRLRRRGVRRLDVVVAARPCSPSSRRKNSPAVLPGPVRGPGGVAEHLLHRRDDQPADPARHGLPQGAGQDEDLPGRLRLRLPAHGQQGDRRLGRRQRRRDRRRGVRPAGPHRLRDDREQAQGLRRRRGVQHPQR